MNIPKAGSELLPGHHFFFENLHKLLKLLTFSQTNEETVLVRSTCTDTPTTPISIDYDSHSLKKDENENLIH